MRLARRAVAAVGMCCGLACASWASSDPAAQLGFPPDVAAAMEGISPDRIRAHIQFLADDLLEGRGTGTRGGDIAAHYIATQFALYGLKPAGDDGGYLQRVDFTGAQTQDATTASLVPARGSPEDLALGTDYVVGNQTQTDSVDIDAPIVFAGYGIEAPEYRWDDFKGVDVKGKVILVIVNEPPSKDPKFFAGETMTYYGRWTYKFEEAARKGAIGVLIIHRTDLASYSWNVVQSSWSNEMVYLANDRDPKLEAAAWIQWDVARRIFADSGLKIDDMVALAGTRRFKARELPVRFKAHIESHVRKFVSYNVVAMLAGTDPGSPTQAVMYTAHYDHLGLDPKLPGDKIYNGFVDNGTGCGMLLELARAFSRSDGPSSASGHFRVGNGGGKRAPRVRISRQAFAHSPCPGRARSELRRDRAARRPGGGERDRRGAHDVLSGRAEDGAGVRLRDSAGCRAGRRALLPLGSLQHGARGRARVLHQYLDQVPRAPVRVGQGEAR